MHELKKLPTHLGRSHRDHFLAIQMNISGIIGRLRRPNLVAERRARLEAELKRQSAAANRVATAYGGCKLPGRPVTEVPLGTLSREEYYGQYVVGSWPPDDGRPLAAGPAAAVVKTPC